MLNQRGRVEHGKLESWGGKSLDVHGWTRDAGPAAEQRAAKWQHQAVLADGGRRWAGGGTFVTRWLAASRTSITKYVKAARDGTLQASSLYCRSIAAA